MRYRAFPVARPVSPAQPAEPPRAVPWRERVGLPVTLLIGAFIAGGLFRLATVSTTMEVASSDLTNGPRFAASHENKKRDADGTEPVSPEPARPVPPADPIDIALATMLSTR